MIERLTVGSLHNRSFVFLAMLGLIGSGVYSLTHLPIDAVPDITNVQVMALTEVSGLGPEEVEQFITIPVENAMNGIPQVNEVRSISQFGISVVTIVFGDGTDIYWARQQVAERITQVRAQIPPEFGQPEMGPIATGLGEIIQFEVKNAPGAKTRRSLMELRTILDWEVARPLKSVPGVVEVNAFGGELKTYEVRLDPQRLLSRNIAVNDVFEAIRRNNSSSGGGYLTRNGEHWVIRAIGLIGDTKALENVVLHATSSGAPIYIKDVADVVNAPMIRAGAVTRDGKGEAVTATVLMLAGENSRVVVDRVKAKLAEIRPALLKDGIEVDMFYDRATLIQRTISTAGKNLIEGGVLVVVVLLVLLGDLTAGLIVALAIPLSMLFAGNLMLYFGVAGSLMSLGALDFGLIVDSAVIVIENVVRRLGHASRDAKTISVVRNATLEVQKPVVFGVAIITLVHLPILALSGVEGKMFRPMALTVIFALAGSLLLSLTITPVLATFFLKPGRGEHETLPIRWAKKVYGPSLRWSMRHPAIVVLAALALLILSVPMALQLGGEFIPKLDEGDLVIVLTRPPSASLEEGLEDSLRFEKALLQRYPDEIRSVVSRTGRPEIGIDPASVNNTDVFILLKPPDEWKKIKTKDELIAAVERVAKVQLPGNLFNFTQPIDMRFNELLAGVRSDVGLSLFGPDLDVLQENANAIAAVLHSIPGATDVKAQVLGGQPVLRIDIKRDQIARYGINAADVLDAVSAIGGKKVGIVVESDRQYRFDLQVRFDPEVRKRPENIRELKIESPSGQMIPIEDLCEIQLEDGVFEIWRKDRQRRATIQANVRGRDLAGFVADAKNAIAAKVPLPEGYRLAWGGTFENLESATKRLTIVVPIALGLIFLLLYFTFGSIRLGVLIFLSVPLAAIGGILALWLRGLNFSISAGVGFIALSGVAVLDGLVLVAAIRQMVEEGVEVGKAVLDASMIRLRPILMTGMVASLGFVPMAISQSSGAEVQRPLATVVIGGIITSMLLKLIVLPVIYPWFDPGRTPDDD